MYLLYLGWAAPPPPSLFYYFQRGQPSAPAAPAAETGNSGCRNQAQAPSHHQEPVTDNDTWLQRPHKFTVSNPSLAVVGR